MFFVVAALFVLGSVPAAAQDDVVIEETIVENGRLNVYLDNLFRYEDFIKTEIDYVNYVRDRVQADVHVLMTSQRTGSGGNEYTIEFTGQQQYAGLVDTLICVTRQTDTQEMIQETLSRIIELGLMPFIARTPFAENIRITYFDDSESSRPMMTQSVDDKWNYWVFNVNTNDRYNGQESQSTLTLRGSISADRVTPYWKMSFDINADYTRRRYEFTDRTTTSITKSREFRALVVKSFGEHWSAGFFGNAESSVFNNIKAQYDFAPAIEYDVFPYSESTRREFRILYRVGVKNNNYAEETVYFKTRENLLYHNLTGTLEIKERWGSISTTLQGSNYFHDFERNNLQLSTNLSFRIIEGLSLDLGGSFSMIHDQIELPRGDATEEEIFLNQRAQSTQYRFSTSVGLRYSFGSIYSNVVNPRFNTGGGGGGGGFGGGGGGGGGF